MSTYDDVVAAADKAHANITGSEDGETVSVMVRFTPGSKDGFTDAESAVGHIISMIPRPRAGSVWGNDGGSVGGAVGLENGYLRLTASGTDKRLAKKLFANEKALQFADAFAGIGDKAGVSAGTQKARVKKEKAETAAAEEFIAKAADEVATKPKRKGKELTITADDIVNERDGKGLSWAQVAVNLDLGSPGAARRAYTQLTGKDHTESVMTGKRAPRGSKILGGNKKSHSPEWNDDSDQDEIANTLNGPWVEESGSGKNFIPAHWTGSSITVRRKLRGTEDTYDEEVNVGGVLSFTFGKNGDQPLQINVTDKETKATRCFFVADIIDVR